MALKSFYESKYGLLKNPFPGNATYAEDSQEIYVPELFGTQRDEFLRKFIVAPLEEGQPMIGAVWSVVPGDPQARGFGKSTLMGEESKGINRDFGFSTLQSLGVTAHEAKANPVLAAYVSFDTKMQGAVGNVDAAAFHLLRFILRGTDSLGSPLHQVLRERAAASVREKGAATGQEGDAIVEAVLDRFRRAASTIDIRRLLEEFLFHLAKGDSKALDEFIQGVGTWHHDRNGLKYLQLFVAFAELAGIQHFTFFVDQVEDFTSNSGVAKIQKNVKIIRDALIESEPFSTRASFVFQLHPDAYERLRNAWVHEDLPSLEWDDPLNESVVVVLRGLDTFESARVVAERFLNHSSVVAPNRVGGITPFTESVLRRVWEETKPRPRWFIRVLRALLRLGKDNKQEIIDDKFAEDKLRVLVDRARRSDAEEEPEVDERLA
jgi:hypothetical protein